MEPSLDSMTYRFLVEQFHLLISTKRARRYHKHILIFAAELLIISPAAHRIVKRSEVIILPEEKNYTSLFLSKSLSDDNLGNLLSELKPEQRVNVTMVDLDTS